MKRPLLVLLLIAPIYVLADCRDLAPDRGVPMASEGEWMLATLNLWRLRNAVKDTDLDSPLPPKRVEQRLDAIARFITTHLQAPHALVLQEVENRALLDSLAERLAASGYRYRSVLIEGNDPSGMDVGLLYRAPVVLDNPRALFAAEPFQGHPLYSRPPLRVSLQAPMKADLVIVHLRSARDLASSRVFEKRRRQAARLAQWVGNQTGPVIVAGDFNSTWGAGRFSDSYRQFALAGLFNVWQALEPSERYSYRYRCRPQALDHVWLSPTLKHRLKAVAVSRGNAGRYKSLYGTDGVSPVSDHDALVVYFER